MGDMSAQLSLGQWLVVVACAVLIGAAKTGVLGAGTLVVPVLAAVFPARESTGILLPLLCVADILGVLFYRQHAVWGVLLRLMPCAAAGVIAGWLFLGRVDNALLRPLIGVIVLAMLGVHLVMRRTGFTVARSNPAAALVVGLLAGFATMTANAAGPIMTLYLLVLGLDKKTFVGTAAWYFFIVNLFKVPFSAQLGLITWQSLSLNLVLVPAIVAGGFGGYWLVKRLPQRWFELLMHTLAAAGAAYLIAAIWLR